MMNIVNLMKKFKQMKLCSQESNKVFTFRSVHGTMRVTLYNNFKCDILYHSNGNTYCYTYDSENNSKINDKLAEFIYKRANEL